MLKKCKTGLKALSTCKFSPLSGSKQIVRDSGEALTGPQIIWNSNKFRNQTNPLRRELDRAQSSTRAPWRGKETNGQWVRYKNTQQRQSEKEGGSSQSARLSMSCAVLEWSRNFLSGTLHMREAKGKRKEPESFLFFFCFVIFLMFFYYDENGSSCGHS